MSDVNTLVERLDLETLDKNLFRGFSPDDGRPRVFGGQVAGQALVAAGRTVADTAKDGDRARVAHSLHAYFLRPGDPKIPIIYEVDRIRDGKSFTTRRVVAIQKGEAIFNMSVSFHKEEKGLEHQKPMPEAADPMSVPSNHERLEKGYEQFKTPLFGFLLKLERPIEQRDLDPMNYLDPKPYTGTKKIWFRSSGQLPDDPMLHQCVLAYASDMSLLDNCINYHGVTWFNPKLIAASLDHAIWFHRPFRADQWLLYVMESPSAAGARGFNLGHVYQEDGRLVASVTQESLMRMTN